jgi:competence protein ComEC
LAAIVISHPDLDHFGALPALLHAFPVKKVYVPEGSSPNPAWSEALRDLDASAADRETLFAGDTLLWEGGTRVRVLWPEPQTPFTDNNRSTVLRVEYGGRRILLTGDIEMPAENAILEEGFDVASDILKVAHHGSRTSSGLDFVAKADPRWAVISCDSTVYGHPHAEAMADLRLIMGDSTRILRTDREGTIAFELSEPGIRRFDPWMER